MEALLAWIHNWLSGDPPPHVWIGATVVNQVEADRDVPKLLQVPARVRFLSIEPMLGPVDVRAYMPHEYTDAGGNAYAGQDVPCSICGVKTSALHWTAAARGLDWIIAGGESGHHARPPHPDSFRSLRDQCAGAGVPFLFKQWGEWAPVDLDNVVGVKDWFIVSRDGGFDIPDGRTPDDGIGEVAMRIAGKKAAGNTLDGRQHLEWPA